MNTLRIEILDESLKSLYKKRVNVEGDAGVDLYFPEEVTIPKEMIENMFGGSIQDTNISYMVTPRSSISKTPLRMSNSVGIMDSGYRGEFMVPIDNLSDEDFVIEKHTRLFQVVSPMLGEIKLEIVDNLSDSERGSGGFGSTGN